MDDFASQSVGGGDKGTPMVFKLTGVVYDASMNPLPNHALKATLLYWQFVDGVSTKIDPPDTITFTSGIGGAYVAYYKGQNNPIPLWDASKPLAVDVGNNQAGWSTQTHGQYSAEPTGASPITIVVSDTVVKQP